MKKLITFRTFKKHCVHYHPFNCRCLRLLKKTIVTEKLSEDERWEKCECHEKNCPTWRNLKSK